MFVCLHGAGPGPEVEEGNRVPEVGKLLSLFPLQPGSSDTSPSRPSAELHRHSKENILSLSCSHSTLS